MGLNLKFYQKKETIEHYIVVNIFLLLVCIFLYRCIIFMLSPFYIDIINKYFNITFELGIMCSIYYMFYYKSLQKIYDNLEQNKVKTKQKNNDNFMYVYKRYIIPFALFIPITILIIPICILNMLVNLDIYINGEP